MEKTNSKRGQSERNIRRAGDLLEQQRRINAELEQIDTETRREAEEGLRHERSVTQMIAQSEPTTPPEYQDTFPSTLSFWYNNLVLAEIADTQISSCRCSSESLFCS